MRGDRCARRAGGLPVTLDRSPLNLGIRQKMLLILLAVLLVAIGSTSWFTLQKQEQDILEATRQRGEDVLRLASHAVALYTVSYDYHSIQLLLDEIVTSPDIIRATVTSPKGNMMAEAGPPASFGEQRPVFRKPVMFDGKPAGELAVELDTEGIVQQVEQSRRELLMRELALVVMVALGEFLALSFFIARPVSIITDSLDRNIDGDGLIRKDIPIFSKDEFGVLAHQFNAMREQLNAANRKLQSRIEAADTRLLETNQALVQQADQLQKMNDQLLELSITDNLTGLYNRRHFEEVTEVELESCRRHGEALSLVLLDIDHFKRVNDTYGHAAGDEALREIARLIRDNVRITDLPCRIGGEEFVVACRTTDREEARMLAEKLRQVIMDTPIELGAATLSITISIGLATVDGDNSSCVLDTHFKHADAALYYSKQHGRNRVTHYADMARET